MALVELILTAPWALPLVPLLTKNLPRTRSLDSLLLTSKRLPEVAREPTPAWLDSALLWPSTIPRPPSESPGDTYEYAGYLRNLLSSFLPPSP